jgi:serine/threonine protein kinase
MTSSRTTDNTVHQRYPYPIAAAWRRVALATNEAQRLQHLLAFQEVLVRTLVVLLAPDCLRSPRDPDWVQALLGLSKRSLGTWVEMTRLSILHVANREGTAPFMPEVAPWFFTERGKPSDVARLIGRLVEERNLIAHGPALSKAATKDKVRQLEEDNRTLLASLRWLAGYRLLRVLTAKPMRRGGFQGKVQIYAGCEVQPEPVRARWDCLLLSESLYLVNPAGDAVLEVSPFLQVRADQGTRREELFVMQELRRGVRLALVNDATGHHYLGGVPSDDGELPFDRWVASEGSLQLHQRNRDDSGALAAPDLWCEGCVDELLDDRFELLEPLGDGGMAKVFRVHDRWFDEEVALKVMHRQHCEDPSFVTRFQREARLQRNLEHPHLLGLLDSGRLQDGRLYIKMPVMPGGTLREHIIPGGMPHELVRRWAGQALEALAHLHSLGLVHRDIKPSNFLLDGAGDLRLADFGIALQPGEARLTRTTERVGSLAYAAPEMRQGTTLTAAADMYGLGLVLHALLTGTEAPPQPGEGVTGELGTLVRELGQHDPDARPTAAQALSRLTAPPAPPPPPPLPPEPEPTALRYHYAGPERRQEGGLEEIAGWILAAPAARHLVWAPGMESWMPWSEVPVLRDHIEPKLPVPPPVPPPSVQATVTMAEPEPEPVPVMVTEVEPVPVEATEERTRAEIFEQNLAAIKRAYPECGLTEPAMVAELETMLREGRFQAISDQGGRILVGLAEVPPNTLSRISERVPALMYEIIQTAEEAQRVMDVAWTQWLDTLRQTRGLCKDIHVAPDIPTRKLRAARESCRLPPYVAVHILVDATVFGSGKNALLICDTGVYMHNNYPVGSLDRTLAPGAYAVPFADFADATFEGDGEHDTMIGDSAGFHDSGSTVIQEEVIALLEGARLRVREGLYGPRLP